MSDRALIGDTEFDVWDEAAIPAWQHVFRRLQKTLHNWANRHASLTAAANDGGPDDPYTALSATEWANDIERFIEPLLEAVAEHTAELVAARLGISFDLHNPLVSQALAAQVNQLHQYGELLRHEIGDALVQGELAGESIPHIADRLTATGALSDSRATMIARTEVVSASNAASLATVRNGGTHRRKKWLCLDGEVRVAGDVRAVARRFEPGPLLRFRWATCRLEAPTPTYGDLTVTPDHPMLTDAGWVAAKFLRPGDCLIGGALVDPIGRTPDEQDRPPTIREVFESAILSRPSERIVSVVPHLDCEDRRYCYVDVVLVDGELRDRVLAAVPDPLRHLTLTVTDEQLGSLSGRSPCLCGIWTDGAAGSGSGALLGSSHRRVTVMVPSVLPGIGLTTDGDTSEPEHSLHCVAAASLGSAEFPQAGPRLIAPYEIFDIEVLEGGRHVYDLETERGWFWANGKIAHNSTHDERTRPTHSTADGQEVDLDAKFLVGGYEADHPGATSLPAGERARCRCTVIYPRSKP